MTGTHKIRTTAALAMLIIAIGSYSQQTGNVVEYFGRETVEEIEEGNVTHVFSRGLFLPVMRPPGALFVSTDPLAWQLAEGVFSTPSEGETAFPDHPDLVWRPVETDEEDRFQNRFLRSSYIYTSIEAPREEIVLLDARGHTRVFINGMPYEGDHYDFGYTLIPFKLKRGLNEFIYTPGRFGRLTSRIVEPSKPVQFTRRDMTLPSLIAGGTTEVWGAVRVINASEEDLHGLSITCILETGERAIWNTGTVLEMSVRKLSFLIPAAEIRQESGMVGATLILSDRSGREIDRTEITLQQHEPDVHHERTFISNIDGSVQYYSIAPSVTPGSGQALVLTVHGAGVEARNQARAYRQKDWAHIVAPTNRRPFGFNWEDWGRIDAMEVFEDASKVFDTRRELSYLTGHSMGGHGTWHLGVTYPDMFAAIAPCAGYPDIIGYGRSETAGRHEGNPHYGMIARGANAGRTLELKRNFLQSGIYILHGDADMVVSVEQARLMRNTLGEFHTNFTYYEYPGGSHWYGDHSVDWFPIFDFFRWQEIPHTNDVTRIEFHTASPPVSSTNHWIRINQQERSHDFSSVEFERRNDTIRGTVNNVESISFLMSLLENENDQVIIIDNFTLTSSGGDDVTLYRKGDGWKVGDPDNGSKYAERYGGFKRAFDNRMVFVYATGGSNEENEWYRNKARFDAETFLYRANGSVDIVADRDFDPAGFPERNVIIYGNASNNLAWEGALGDVPVLVRNGAIEFGNSRVYEGDDLAALFVYPRTGCDTASVGVVAGTGIRGMKAAFANDYFSGITGYPDLKIFSSGMLNEGIDGIIVSGFFGNDWSVENGEFIH